MLSVKVLSKCKLSRISNYVMVCWISKRHGPSLIPLSLEEQEEFERLQLKAQVTDVIEDYNKRQSGIESSQSSILQKNESEFSQEFNRTIPEFVGDTNPKTGEVGGPKQDPLRHGDYSFNGRVTDF